MNVYTKVKEGITFKYMDEKMTVLHCEDGFAVLWPNGEGHNYLGNKYISPAEFKEFQQKAKDETKK